MRAGLGGASVGRREETGGELHLHRQSEGQAVHPHGRAAVAAPDAQYGEKQVGGPVEHPGVVGKIGSGGDKAQYTHQLHPLQAAGGLPEHGQEVQGRETGAS